MIDTIPGLGRLQQQQQRQQQQPALSRQHDMEDGELMEEDASSASASTSFANRPSLASWTPLPPPTPEPPQRPRPVIQPIPSLESPQRPSFKAPQRPSRPDAPARNKSSQTLYESVTAPDPDFNMLIAEYQLQKARTEEKSVKSGETPSASDIPGLGHAPHFKTGAQPFQSGSKAPYMPRQNPSTQNTRL